MERVPRSSADYSLSLDFHVFEPRISTTASARPEACPVARWHAAHGGALTNAWHQEVVLPDPAVGFVLAHANGERCQDELVSDVQRALLAGAVPAEGVVSALVEESLRLLHDFALIRG